MPLWRERVLRASAEVRRGEWTTYGDIAAAAGGSRLGARAVGRLAARDPAFRNAHRVILRHGHIPDGWGRPHSGPDDCRARLLAEGVMFAGGAADPGCHVGWEILTSRLE